MNRILVSIAALISIPLFCRGVEAGELYGTWRLLGATTTLVATGEKADAYGPSPTGFLSYSSDGRMSAIIAYTLRPKPAEVTQLTDEVRVKLYQTFLAYAGTFSLKGATVTHHIDVSSNEVWTGSDQVRYVKLVGDTLVIRTDPMPRRPDNKMSVFELRWAKLKPASNVPVK
jgi:hypothetical protein